MYRAWKRGVQPSISNESERGSTLLETALAMALFGSILVLVNSIVSEELERQSNASLGRDLRLLTEFSQNYMRSEYQNLQNQLTNLQNPNAILEISMQTLVDKGYLPPSFLESGTHKNGENQSYAILVRGVSRLDTSIPQNTLTSADIDKDGDHLVDSFLVDGKSGNDEFDLEAVLVTTGGTALPPHRGNQAVLASETAVAGYVQTMGTASGVFGNWSLDIRPFQSLNAYPSPGRFVSLLALSGFGVLDFRTGGNPTDEKQSGNPFDRCPNFRGDNLAECASSNDIFTEAVFRSVDNDGDGVTDSFGSINGVHQISMGQPVDSDNDGNEDVFPEIINVLRLVCDQSRSATASVGTLLMDCAHINLTGSLEVSGSVNINNGLSLARDLDAAGEVSGERFIADAIGGQDLTEGIFSGQIVAMNGRRMIAKPTCSDADSTALILVVPASYQSPDGSPIVGMKALATSSRDRNQWQIQIQAALDRDNDNDGQADVVNLHSNQDYALVLTKCS